MMRAWIVVACLVASGCKKKEPKRGEGESCRDSYGYRCDDMPCIDGVCVAASRAEAAKAALDARLRQAKLDKEAQNARNAEAARQAAAEKELQLLKESGVTPPPTIAERAVLPPGPGTRVRVVTVTSTTSAFAACRETERLTSGGCRSSHPLIASHPSHHGEEDTVGARWSCVSQAAGAAVTAFALCTAAR